MSQSVYSSKTTSSKESKEGSDRSSRTGHEDISSRGSGAPSKGRLRKAEMEFDRRQIRLKLAEKLETMGQNEDAEVLLHEVFEDEVFDEDPGEEFPWKQREAVVAAAARGGVSEDRREGLDSMELALKAQTTTATTTTASSIAKTFYQPHITKTRSARALADWGLYNQASQHSNTSSTVSSSNHYRNVNRGSVTAAASISLSNHSSASSTSSKKLMLAGTDYEYDRRAQLLEQQQLQQQQQDTSTPLLFRCVYLLVAISAVIGFIYFTVYFKLGYYEGVAPAGNFQLKGNGMQPTTTTTNTADGGLPKSNGI